MIVIIVIIYFSSVPQYMAFGLSGSNSSTLMDGADVTVVWFQSSLVPRAQDYHLRRNNRVQVSLQHH